MRAVEMEGFTYSYPRASSPSLDDIHLLVEQGEFVLLAGPSGGGKSTLLRAMSALVPSFHGGRVRGRTVVCGIDTRETGPADLFGTVGMVFQDPENQLVMTRARNDIAFGLENLGWAPDRVWERVEEVAGMCGVTHLLDRFVPELSGGEKQRLAIAAAMAPGPRVLLMDEPTSQLDPSASRELLGLIGDIHRGEGITVVMAEHRLDRCLGMAGRVVVLEAGEVTYDGGPRGLVGGLGAGSPPAGGRGFNKSYVPPLNRVWEMMGGDGTEGAVRPRKTPLTESEALKDLGPKLRGIMRDGRSRTGPPPANGAVLGNGDGNGREVVRCRGLRFAYDGGADVLRGVSLTVREGEVMAILGPNGAGKTTLVRMLNGLQRPRFGTVSIMGRDISRRTTAQLARTVGYLAQDPGGYLTRDTLERELALTLRLQKVPRARWEERIRRTLGLLGLEDHAGTDPRSLSCGGRHLSALASVLVGRPRVLVLDEPTRGVDPGYKEKLARLIRRLARKGMTVVIVTQDAEFASETAGRCAILAGGRVERVGPAHRVLSRRGPYETQVAALARRAWGSGRNSGGRVPINIDDVGRLLGIGGMRNAG